MYFIVKRGDDVMRVQVLDDGTIKTETSEVSAANHTDAEDFLTDMQKLTGGPETREHREHEKPHDRYGTHGHHHHA